MSYVSEQLAELKRVFTSRLTTILHARIPYTDEEAKKSIAALPGEVKSAVAAAQTPADDVTHLFSLGGQG